MPSCYDFTVDDVGGILSGPDEATLCFAPSQVISFFADE
jgi:hypothetical protein